MEFQLPPIRRVPDIEINHDMPLNNEPRDRDERRIQQLRNDILEVWPTKTLESIKSMTYGTSESNTYIINTESEDEIETDENGDLKVIHREIPDSPLGKHVDALLRKGWAVATVKGNSLFVSRLRRTDPPKNSELKPANAYKFESSENLMYVPEVCEFCESHESYELVVVDTEKSKFTETENPVFERACKQCIEDHSYPTSQEYYDK